MIDPIWPASARALSTEPYDQTRAAAISDLAGGAIVSWEDNRNFSGSTNSDIYAHRVLANGTIDARWSVNGRPLCTAPREQLRPAIAPDGAGGAVVAWSDYRNGAPDIFAQHIQANGMIDSGTVSVAAEGAFMLGLHSVSPNPARWGTVLHVSFQLESQAPTSLELYDPSGRRIATRDVGSPAKGSHTLELALGQGHAAGVYWVRLRQGDWARSMRVVVLD